MFHKFNEDSIYTKFIKQLVATTYVPTIEIWKPGKPIIKGFQYITKNYIVEAKESWNQDSGIELNDIYNGYFNIIKPYIEGKEYQNITSNYISNKFMYDSKTHFYLGQYLRMLRDLHDLDLMCFYNCVTGVTSDKIRLGSEKDPNEVITNNKEEDNYTTLLVPIYFNQDYTIYLNSSAPIKMRGIFYDEVTNVSVKNLSESKVIEYPSSSSSKPILFRLNQKIGAGYYSMYYRNYLTLALQIPKNIKNVVILEGDYTNSKLYIENSQNKIPEVTYGTIDYSNLTTEEINKHCIGIPALTRSIKNELYAYDDKLLEYLLLNAIHSEEEISKNIERVQTYSSSYECEKYNGTRFDKKYTRGVWDNNLRMFLYDLVTKGGKNNKRAHLDPITIDILGYVDKDVETIITRGQDV